MNRSGLLGVTPVVLSALAIAACGSASSSSSSSAAAAAAASSSSTGSPSTSSSSSTSGGRYGGSSTAASGTTSAAAPAAAVTVTTAHGKLGTFLAAGPKQLTVYLFQGDKGTTSNCYGQCAKFWPPVLGKASATGAASTADLGTTTRKDGTVQVTYKGHPLYYFLPDTTAGQAKGQAVKAFGAEWYVLAPSGKKIDNS